MARERRTGDYYPTPPCAALAMGEVVRAYDSDTRIPEIALDPSAGAGTLLKWAAPYYVQTAIELHPVLAAHCRRRGIEVTEGDALTLPGPWFEATVYISNPPFNLLELFVRRILFVLRAAVGAGWVKRAHVLLPIGWLQAKARADLPEPDLALFTWRPRFLLDADASGPSQTYAIATWTTQTVLRPREYGTVRRLPRPTPTAEQLATYETVSALAGSL